MAEMQMLLDAQAKIKNKRDYDYQRAGKKVIADEVEDHMLEKYKDWKDRNFGKAQQDEVKQIPKQAIVDDMYTKNFKYNTSVAELKRVWVGSEGQFKAQDLRSWYRIYDSTKIRQAQPFMHKVMSAFKKDDLVEHIRPD